MRVPAWLRASVVCGLVAAPGLPSPPPEAKQVADSALEHHQSLEGLSGLANLPARGQWRQGFTLADLDGDGRLDLVHGALRAGERVPRLFLGDGAGGFRPWTAARFPDEPFDYGDAAAADFDGDGHTDLALGMHLRGIAVLYGDGAGGFAPTPAGLTAPLGLSPAGAGDFPTVALEAADWNGDGRIDLAALGEGPRPGVTGGVGFAVLLNLEGGWRRIAGEDPGRLFGDGLVVADVDGDGRLDAIATSRSLSHRGQVFLGRGDAGWELAKAPLRKPAYVTAVAACDLDGDGRAEVVLGVLERYRKGWRSAVDLLEVGEGGRWSRRTASEGGREEAPRALACADFDGDGDTDLAAGTVDGQVTIRQNQGQGRLGRAKTIFESAGADGCGVRHLVPAELDGRPGLELVASFAGESGPACRSGGALRVLEKQ